MRLHRFYIPEKIGAQTDVVIHSAEQINQIKKVFRLKIGDSIILFDGSGSDYACRIDDINKNSISLIVTEASKSRFMPERDVILCAGIVKKDKFEWIVEKATELGVGRIIPILTERSEKKGLNMERLKKIAIEASEQSGRGDVPIIDPVQNLEDVLFGLNGMHTIVFHTDGMLRPALAGRSDLDENHGPTSIFIGPEGGWSPKELELFQEKDIPIYSFGPQILRAETAVVAALFIVTMRCYN